MKRIRCAPGSSQPYDHSGPSAIERTSSHSSSEAFIYTHMIRIGQMRDDGIAATTAEWSHSLAM
jgi:hypothetical protein